MSPTPTPNGGWACPRHALALRPAEAGTGEIRWSLWLCPAGCAWELGYHGSWDPRWLPARPTAA